MEEKTDDGTRMVTRVHGRQGLDVSWSKRSSHGDVKVSGGLEPGTNPNCHRNTSSEVPKR